MSGPAQLLLLLLAVLREQTQTLSQLATSSSSDH